MRTLIEMSLIRASRIATTATVEELMKAVRSLREGLPADLPAPQAASPAAVPPPTVAPAAPAPAAPAPAAPAPGSIPAAKSGTSDRGISQSRKAILDDEKLNSMLKAFPGSSVVGIRDGN